MSQSKNSIDEEYYPISEEILTSFSRFRPSIDLFIFNEEALSLHPVAKKGQRLTDPKIEEIANACKEGLLFVSRSDKHIYVNHLAKQAEFVLIDTNLHEKEILDILLQAFHLRVQTMFEQPMQNSYVGLHKDLMVFTEYVWEDIEKLDLFMENLYIGDHDLTQHTINTIFIGSWLYLHVATNPQRKIFDRIVQGFALHDIGYNKIPSFIVNKKSKPTMEEMEKIQTHPRLGLAVAQKVEVSYDEVNQIIFQHHELLDGKGYPNRLNSSSLAEFGMMSAVVDAFSLMIMEGPRDKRLSTLTAATQLSKDSKYHPKYTSALYKAYADGTFSDR